MILRRLDKVAFKYEITQMYQIAKASGNEQRGTSFNFYEESKQNDDESQIVFNTFDRIQMVVLQSQLRAI